MQTEKLEYNKPVLKKIGTINKVTKGLTGQVSDGFGGNMPG